MPSFTRYYNSDAGVNSSHLGHHWRHSYDRLVYERETAGIRTADVYRPDGKGMTFTLTGSSWIPVSDIVARLESIEDGEGNITGWRYTTKDDSVETYDAAGRLLTITPRSGLATTLAYNPDSLLESVTGPFGHTLVFGYTDRQITTLTGPAGEIYRYGYDTEGRLVTVAYPDETPADENDNPVRTYLYEDTNFPNALTGILDENGDRFATWDYDSEGRAILSKHGDDADQIGLTYNTTEGTTTVTSPLGLDHTFTWAGINGLKRPAATTGGPSSLCGSQSASQGFDANGFLDSRTDFNGNTTTFIKNSRGLETSRTEAA
ncbi:MAG: RHS repeat protein, partial [Gammaproteobacteria bacterium]|nr:RHS repeat protein [Gammaproteobacteria bacterium]